MHDSAENGTWAHLPVCDQVHTRVALDSVCGTLSSHMSSTLALGRSRVIEGRINWPLCIWLNVLRPKAENNVYLASVYLPCTGSARKQHTALQRWWQAFGGTALVRLHAWRSVCMESLPNAVLVASCASGE